MTVSGRWDGASQLAEGNKWAFFPSAALGWRLDQVYGKLQDSFLENGFSPVENSYWDPTYFPREHFLIKALLKAYQKVTKDKSEPTYSGSGSYSKSIPNIAAFGAIFPGESLAWHQKNEYIDIDSLVKTCRIYAEAIYELGSL